MLIRGNDGRQIRVDKGLVADIGAGLGRTPGEEVLEAGAGAILPGLHDHHVHLRALAAASSSVRAGPPEVTDADALARALVSASHRAGPGAWVRAVGYHESVAGDLDRGALDRMGLAGPVRVQHRSGAFWVLSSAALESVGADSSAAPRGVERDEHGVPTGRIWREDRWLGQRVGRAPIDFAAVGRRAAAWGLTGFTDATVGQKAGDLDDLVAASAEGALPQRLLLMADVGVRLDGTARASIGPAKVLLDDIGLPSLDDLVDLVRAAHSERRGVAVHCVTAVQAALTVAALAATRASGVVDRVEHGALLSPGLVAALREAGTTVVTQPAFVEARGDQYLADVDPGEQGDLWRLASLIREGVSIAAGSDAPLGPANPWQGVRAAVTRRTSGGRVLGDAERVDPATALSLWLGASDRPAAPRCLEPGAAADICVLGVPMEEALAGREDPPVAATIVAGEVVYRGQ